MGSLTSRPKVPATIARPTIITVPMAASVSTYAPPAAVLPDSVNVTTSSDPEQMDETVQAEARSMGLLNRSRGRLSTVLTGFRGVLTQAASGAGQRKTLLGE